MLNFNIVVIIIIFGSSSFWTEVCQCVRCVTVGFELVTFAGLTLTTLHTTERIEKTTTSYDLFTMYKIKTVF